MVGLSASSVIVYWQLARSLSEIVDQSLIARAGDIEDSLSIRNGVIALIAEPEKAHGDSEDISSPQDTYVRLWSPDMQTSRTLDPGLAMAVRALLLPAVPETAQTGFALATAPTNPPDGAVPRPDRVALIRLPRSGQPAGYLEVGMSLGPIFNTLDRLRAVTLAVVPPLLVALGLAVWLLVTRALHPLNRLSQQAALIAPGNIGTGLDVPATGDEVERLALVLNQMLDRLAEGFRRERRLIADASHELRTPLAVMRSEIDVAVREGAPVSADTLSDLGQEVDRLQSMVASLLQLSRSDAGAMSLELEPVRLDDLVHMVCAQCETLASEKEIPILMGEMAPVVVQGDQARLIQLMLNLVENAVRYTQAGGTVSVDVIPPGTGIPGGRPGEAACIVTDNGPGIGPEHLPHVFERFYRADEARTTGGTGLGLCIAQTIAVAHGGRIELESRPGHGTTARVFIPVGHPPA
jgi:signal transduction histidine kinase